MRATTPMRTTRSSNGSNKKFTLKNYERKNANDSPGGVPEPWNYRAECRAKSCPGPQRGPVPLQRCEQRDDKNGDARIDYLFVGLAGCRWTSVPRDAEKKRSWADRRTGRIFENHQWHEDRVQHPQRVPVQPLPGLCG